MTVFSALQLNLPGGVGVHGGVYTTSDMKYDIECGYLVNLLAMHVEGAAEPTAGEVDGGDAGGSGGGKKIFFSNDNWLANSCNGTHSTGYLICSIYSKS